MCVWGAHLACAPKLFLSQLCPPQHQPGLVLKGASEHPSPQDNLMSEVTCVSIMPSIEHSPSALSLEACHPGWGSFLFPA